MLSLRRKLPAGVLLTLSHEFHKCGKCERSYDMHKRLPGFCGVKPGTRSTSGPTGDFRYAARSKPANASAEGTRGLQEYITNCPEDKAPSRRRGTTASEDWGVMPYEAEKQKTGPVWWGQTGPVVIFGDARPTVQGAEDGGYLATAR